MSLDLYTIKNHLRIPHNLEDEVILDYIEFAKNDVTEAVYDATDVNVNTEGLENDPSFKRAVIMLTAYYYENRLTISEINMHESPFSVTHAIQTLRAHRDRYYETE